MPAPHNECFILADKLTKRYDEARQNALDAVALWLSFWRDVFVTASGADLPLVNVDFAAQVLGAAAGMDPGTARELVIAHEKALQDLDHYANAQLQLEALMLKWPRMSLTPEAHS
jgi:hypothetical protein